MSHDRRMQPPSGNEEPPVGRHRTLIFILLLFSPAIVVGLYLLGVEFFAFLVYG